jgi:hypothetical protein
MRRRYSDDGENHHTVGAKILEACGRGLLIATAGLVLGAMLGTSHLASVGAWTLGLAAAAGAGLTIGAAIVHNMGCCPRDAEPEDSRQKAEVLTLATVPSVLEAETGTPTERRSRYMVLLEQEREQQHGHRR